MSTRPTRLIAARLAAPMLMLLAVGCSAQVTAIPSADSPLPTPAEPPIETATLPPEAAGPAGTQLAALNDATGTAHALVTATRAAIATATAGPALAEPGAPAGWNLILYEPFADNARKWPEGPDDSNPLVHQEHTIIGGQYMVKATARRDFSAYVYPQMPAVLDFYAAVDARLLDGDPATEYGLVASLDPAAGDYYAFLLDARGLWAFSLHKSGQWTVIESGHAGQISADGSRLALLRHQNDFTLYLDNQRIASAHNDQLTAPGKLGLIVEGNVPGAQATVTFGNFTVLTP